MKKLLLLSVFAIAFAFSGKTQSINCSDFCVLNIGNVDTINNTLDVTIYNGGTTFMNYPIVVVLNSIGDTIANINNLFYFFGHASMDTLTHTIPTTVDSIPAGFTGTVYYMDGFDSTTCAYTYPTPCTVGIIESMIAAEVTVYPNPASTMINVSLIQTAAETATINLYEASGKLAHSISTNENTISIDRGNLRSGIYFLQVRIGDKLLTKKIVLE